LFEAVPASVRPQPNSLAARRLPMLRLHARRLPDKPPRCEPCHDLFVVPLVQLTPRIWLLRFPVVNAYIVRTTDGVAVIDTGSVGSDSDVIAAICELGATASDLRWIVLTHCHKDHVGSAAHSPSIRAQSCWRAQETHRSLPASRPNLKR